MTSKKIIYNIFQKYSINWTMLLYSRLQKKSVQIYFRNTPWWGQVNDLTSKIENRGLQSYCSTPIEVDQLITGRSLWDYTLKLFWWFFTFSKPCCRSIWNHIEHFGVKIKIFFFLSTSFFNTCQIWSKIEKAVFHPSHGHRNAGTLP